MSAPVRLQVWDPTFTTLRATATDVIAASGLDELNEHGNGSITLLAGTPALASIEDRCIIAVAHRNAAGGWVPAHAWIAEVHQDTLVAVGDGTKLATTWTGRGLLGMLKDSPIVERQPQPYTPELRVDWASPEVPATTWAAPHVRSIQGLTGVVPPVGWAGQPWSYPNPLVRLLWATAPVGAPPHDDPGFVVFHNTFTTSGPETIHVYPIGDDTVQVAIDGAVLAPESDPTSTAMNETAYRKLEIPAAGTHTVRVLVQNVAHPSIATNSGCMGIAIGREQIQTVFGGPHRVIDWLLTSASSGWKCLPFATRADGPGLNNGELHNLLFVRAQARGELTGWTFSFNTVNDSAGAPWPQLPGTSFSTDRTLYDVDGEIAGEGWATFRAGATALRLDAWINRGTVRAGAAVETAVNATVLQRVGDSSAALTGLRVMWREGAVTVGTGPRVGIMSTDAETETEAIRRGTAQLAQSGPAEQVTLAWIPTGDDDTPFIGLEVADTIPTPAGDLRVVSIAWALAGDSITWTVELVTPRMGELDRQARLNRRMAAGSLGGRSDLVAPTTVRQPAAGTVRTETISFQPPDPATIGVDSPPETLSAPGVVHRARIFCSDATAATGPTTLDLRINGSPSLWSFTLPAGQTEAWYTALVIVGDTNIGYTLRPSAIGGHKGINCELVASLLP